MVPLRASVIALAPLALAGSLGCAPKTMYSWGGYDEALYDHYKNPQKRDEFVAKLSNVITEAEKTGGVVPPGAYAEYGWALYEEGRGDEAVAYFEKEKKLWPASQPLMDKLIRNIARAKGPQPAAVPASATDEARK
jgi:hypothetical protein